MYAQTAVFIIIFFDPLVRLFSNFACRIHFLLRIFWDYRRQNRLRLKFLEIFGHLAKFGQNRPKFFSEFCFVLVLFWSSFSRWFRKSQSRCMKMPRKKVMSDLLQLLLRLLQLLSLITFFLGTFMRRDLDIRNHREKLDQKRANTKQNSKNIFNPNPNTKIK